MANLTPDIKDLFINPYNFLPLTARVLRKNIADESYGEKLTGYTLCTLKVKDMLALPDHNAEDRNISRAYDFFKIDGKPVIPGSEIRGCIRSVFEAITPSCFSVINGNVLTSRVSRPENGGDPGILEYNKDTRRWELYEAEKCKYRKSGKDTDVTRNWKPFKPNGRWESYFYKTSEEPIFYPTDAQVENLDEILDIYKEYNASNSRFCKCLSETKENLKSKNKIAVFYSLSAGNNNTKMLTYFSPAQVGRNMYRNTIPDLLGEHNKCSGKSGYCPACRLFGSLGENNPIASKIRFGDATEKNVIISKNYINLPELSSPKITSVEFYTRKSNEDNLKNVDIWNYDSEYVKLRGRKFYFHSAPQSKKRLGERSIATKPALANSEFTFKLYFDKISEKELKQLLWVLTLGENDIGGNQMHKIGTGRPVGYGSVKITVDEIVTRTICNNTDYQLQKKSYDDYDISDDLFMNSEKKNVNEAFNVLKLITNYNYKENLKVSYPIADTGEKNKNATASHQWFTANRSGRKFQYILPQISEKAEDLLLPAMKASYDNSTRENDGIKKQAGNCIDCGCPTDINPKTGKVNKRCKKCYEKYIKNR